MMGGGLPPIVDHNARSAGTDAAGYMTESPGFSAFVLEDGVVYQTYATTWRGLEFVMPLRDPRPRAEGPRRGRRVAALAPPPQRLRRRVRGLSDHVEG